MKHKLHLTLFFALFFTVGVYADNPGEEVVEEPVVVEETVETESSSDDSSEDQALQRIF